MQALQLLSIVDVLSKCNYLVNSFQSLSGNLDTCNKMTNYN